MIGRLLRKPLTWVVAVALGVGAAFGLYWFQPWKLVTNTEVNEIPPPAAAVAAAPSPTSPVAPPAAKAVDRLLARGTFVTHEHQTTGTVRLQQSANGKRLLVIENLNTSDGPDLRVWITDQAVKEGIAGWKVFDDGRYTELGALKGNRGTQTYEIPASVDLASFRSVSIWCKRFSVSFGAAELVKG